MKSLSSCLVSLSNAISFLGGFSFSARWFPFCLLVTTIPEPIIAIKLPPFPSSYLPHGRLRLISLIHSPFCDVVGRTRSCQCCLLNCSVKLMMNLGRLMRHLSNRATPPPGVSHWSQTLYKHGLIPCLQFQQEK